MNEPLIGVVVAHEQLAEALVAAVQAITGEDHGLVPVSNIGCDRAAIMERLEEAIAGRGAVVFADLPGGSCAFGAGAFAVRHPEVAVVAGVNLAMLVDFVFHRTLTAGEAATRAVEVGKHAVMAVGGPRTEAAR